LWLERENVDFCFFIYYRYRGILDWAKVASMIRGARGSDVCVTISRYGHSERISLKRESAIPAPGRVKTPYGTPPGLPSPFPPSIPLAEDRAVPRANSVLGPSETELKSANNDKDHRNSAFCSPLKQANPRASHDANSKASHEANPKASHGLDLELSRLQCVQEREGVRHMVTGPDALVTSPQTKGKVGTPPYSLEDMRKDCAPEPEVRTHELPSTLPTRKELVSLLDQQLKREQVQHKAVVRELEASVSNLETSLRASRASALKAEQKLAAQADSRQQAVLTYEARIAALEQELCELKEERQFGSEVRRQALNDSTMKAIELDRMREVHERQKEAHAMQISLLKEAHEKQMSATREHACMVQECFEAEQSLSKRLAMQVHTCW
jgi:hypothetical protein